MNLFARSAASLQAPPEDRARAMRATATGMLVLIAAIFVTAHSLRESHPAWGFVAAFSEAAMVGGLADWFAVTALFRHPLGLPIPHTAIVPRNKDRIGDQLAVFLRDNFLTPSVVARRMRRFDVAGAAGRFLASPPGEGRMREGAARLVAMVLESLDDERLGGTIKSAIASRLRDLDIAPLLGRLTETAIRENRHAPVIDNVIRWAANTLDTNEEMVRQMIYQRTSKVMRWLAIDERVSDALINGLRKLFIQMQADPQHPLRGKANEALVRLAFDLQHGEAMQARVETFKRDMLANPAFTDWLDGLWQSTRAGLLGAARNPDRLMAGKFGEAVRDLGRTLQEDPKLRRAINSFARRTTVGVVADYGDGIVKLVSETVRSWDADTVTGRLENAVGRDLQYIRINGTLVGGLVGLAIYTATVLS